MRQISLQSLIKNTLWVSIYTGLFRLLTLAIAIMSARMLSVENYGKVSVLQSSSSLFIMFATMALGTVATKLVAQADNRYLRPITQINWAFCLSVGTLVFLAREWIATEVYQDTSLSDFIAVLSIYIIVCGLTQVQTGLLAGKQAYSSIATINLISGVVGIGIVYTSIAYLELWGWLLGITAVESFKVLLLQRAIGCRLEQAPLLSPRADRRYVIKLALPVALSGFFILPVNWFLLRSLLLKEGYLDVAIMNIADQWIAILTFVPIALGDAMLPIMAKMQGKKARKIASTQALKINAFLALVASVPIALLADYVLLLYGKEYVEYGHVFWIVAPLVVVLSLTNQLNNRVIADDKAKAMLLSNIIWMVMCLPLALVLLELGWGIVGLLTARLAAYLVKMSYLLYVSSK